MQPERSPIDGGFGRPVFDAQAVFRAVMDAMARPGMVRPFGERVAPPAPLSPAAAAVALTLCDSDTPLWLDQPLQAVAAVRSWLAFYCGAPLARTPLEAHFALVASPADMVALDAFAQGTQEYPDRSVTIVLQVTSLSTGRSLRLEGPGIEKAAMLAPSALPRHFAEQWRQNNGRFPRGVDLVFAAPEGVACLPRTTRVALLEG
jgi:alpha-D-ribose 1-methylphosphonate 5-triphosphate synthase subunit PhnH